MANLSICNRTWHVMLEANPKHLGNDVFGHADSEKQLITISDNLQDEVGRTTLLHETIHACHMTSTNGHPRDEEACVQSLEVALYSLLRNPSNKWWLQLMLQDVYNLKDAKPAKEVRAKASRPRRPRTGRTRR